MASLAIDTVVMASCSSSSSPSLSSRPISDGHRLFPSRAEGDCCSSVSGWRSRTHREGRWVGTVVCGLQFAAGRSLSPLSPTSPKWPSDGFGRDFPRGPTVQRFWQNKICRESDRGRTGRGNGVVTTALPIDSYWITVAQAVGVAVLMGGSAVVAGILINIRIEVEALAEFRELEAKGLLPNDFIIPEGSPFEVDDPVYIFQNKELSSAPSRNRPVREEFATQLETEKETATK